MAWYEQLAVSLAGGAAASLLTVWLSLKRFHRERWWQRRFDGCAAVIEALHDQQRYLDLLWGEYAERRNYDPVFFAEAEKRGVEGGRSLRRYADLGELALPKTVAILVREFAQDRSSPDDEWNDYLDRINRDRALVTEVLKKVPAAALKELGLSKKRGRALD